MLSDGMAFSLPITFGSPQSPPALLAAPATVGAAPGGGRGGSRGGGRGGGAVPLAAVVAALVGGRQAGRRGGRAAACAVERKKDFNVQPVDRFTEWENEKASMEGQELFWRPDHKDLERVDNEGWKWFLCKDGKSQRWRREDQIGTYRYIDTGYEGRNEKGEWVKEGVAPTDVSHLTEEQRARLILELKGEIKVDPRVIDELSSFRPMPEVPPIEKWPFMETTVKEEYYVTNEQLEGYRVLDQTKDTGQAFYLSGRWKNANEARRHLGYTNRDLIEDVSNMNGSVLALRELAKELERVTRFRKLLRNSAPEDELPSDSARLRGMRIHSVVGTENGSAMAMWQYKEDTKKALIDVCIGDDCMDRGPYAEEVLLRYIMREAGSLGAEKIWLRTRRSESGKVLEPAYFAKFGFHKIPIDLQENEDWESIGVVPSRVAAVERVSGMSLWLSTRGLGRVLDKANEWCIEMGACELGEVVDNREDLADFLGDDLTAEEREQFLCF